MTWRSLIYHTILRASGANTSGHACHAILRRFIFLLAARQSHFWYPSSTSQHTFPLVKPPSHSISLKAWPERMGKHRREHGQILIPWQPVPVRWALARGGIPSTTISVIGIGARSATSVRPLDFLYSLVSDLSDRALSLAKVEGSYPTAGPTCVGPGGL